MLPDFSVSPPDAEAAPTDLSRRPVTLADVERRSRVAGGTGGIDMLLREFLDEFYFADTIDARAAMLAEEPALTANDRANAYLAAVAEHLSLRNKIRVPAWTAKRDRFLSRPFFPSGLESLKSTVLVESPVAFRRRLIFVEKDPLYRPRRDARGIGGTFESGA